MTGYMCMARVDGNAVTAVNLEISGRLMVSRSGFAAFKTTGDVVKFIDDPASPAPDLFGGLPIFEVRWDQEADVLVAVTQALHLVSYDAISGVTRDFGPVVRTVQARSFMVLADGAVARVAPTESGSATKDLKIHYADGSQDTAVAGKTDISMTGSARSSSVLYWYSEGGRTTLGVFDAVDAKDKILTTDMTQIPVLDPVGKVAYFSESAVNIYSDLVKRVRLDTLTVEDVSNLRDRYCSRRQSLYLWPDAFISIQRFDEATKACVEDMFDLERGLKATLPGKDRISAISQVDFSAESGAVNYAGVFLGGESESLALIKPGQDAPEILHRARPGDRTYFSLGSPLVAGYLTREALEVSVWQTGHDKREIKVAFGTRQFNTNVKPVDLGSGALAISFVREDATIALHSALNGVVDGEISTPGAAVSGVYQLAGRDALMYTENIGGVRSVYVWMNSAKHLVSPGASNTNVTCVQAMEGKIVCLENGTGGREAIEYDVDGKSRKILLDTSVNPKKVQFVDPGLLLYTDSSIYIYDQTKTVRKLADVVLTSNVNFIKSEGNYLYGASAAADSSELLRLNLQTGELKSMDFADKICRLVSASGLGFAAVVTGAGCDEVRLTDESHATSKVWAGYSYLQFLGFVPGGGVITKSDDDSSIFISNTASGEVDSLVDVPDGRYVRYVGRSADLKKVYVVANSAGRNLEALYSFQLP